MQAFKKLDRTNTGEITIEDLKVPEKSLGSDLVDFETFANSFEVFVRILLSSSASMRSLVIDCSNVYFFVQILTISIPNVL